MVNDKRPRNVFFLVLLSMFYFSAILLLLIVLVALFKFVVNMADGC